MEDTAAHTDPRSRANLHMAHRLKSGLLDAICFWGEKAARMQEIKMAPAEQTAFSENLLFSSLSLFLMLFDAFDGL